MTQKDPARIRWAPRLRPSLLRRLYESDAQGFRDIELCDDVGTTLYMRCRAFVLVHHRQVECPACHTVFDVSPQGKSHCPQKGCDWTTTPSVYAQSIRNHYAFPGGAMDAFLAFYRRYPKARTYQDKILLIDQLIHSFHVVEETGKPTKSVASKLLEGNKKAVVRFLDDLSARNPDDKTKWRQTVTVTIDKHVIWLLSYDTFLLRFRLLHAISSRFPEPSEVECVASVFRLGDLALRHKSMDRFPLGSGPPQERAHRILLHRMNGRNAQ
jgi:hypothetical protein